MAVKKGNENAQIKSIIFLLIDGDKNLGGGDKGDDRQQVLFGPFFEYLARLINGVVVPAASVLVADCCVFSMLFIAA